MILDIQWKDKAPEQIQNVRRVSLYPNGNTRLNAPAEAIIYFMYTLQNRYINLAEVECINYTND